MLDDTFEVAAVVCVVAAVDGVQLEPFLVMPLIFIFRANLLASVSSPLSPLAPFVLSVEAGAVASPVLPFRLIIITFVFDGTLLLLLLLLLCSPFVCTFVFPVLVVTVVDDFLVLEFLEAIAFVVAEDDDEVGAFLLRCSDDDVTAAAPDCPPPLALVTLAMECRRLLLPANC